MINNRKYRNYEDVVKDEKLLALSDTDIVLEFAGMLTSIYPHLVKINAHCYDPFDEITERLFYSFVYRAFEAKYGCSIKHSYTHRYAFHMDRFKGINHIRVIPKGYPVEMIDGTSGKLTMSKTDLEGKIMVFILFGDSINNLTGGEDLIEIKAVNFNYTEVRIFDNNSGLPYSHNHGYWLRNKDVDYELVLEDYDDE
jgi:hypothetical protein